MSASEVVVVACAAVGVALWVPPGPRRLGVARSTSGPGEVRSGDTEDGLLVRLRGVWAASAALGAWFLLGPPLAVLASPAALVGVLVVVARAEPPEERRRRERRRHDLPSFVELYAAALHAGAAPGVALDLACTALPGPVADELRPVRARLALGAAPATVWGDLAAHAELGRLGRTLARAEASGAPVVDAVRDLAEELSARARAEAEDRARTVGVKAAVPLGLCLLPAFLLLGIVPLVLGAVEGLAW